MANLKGIEAHFVGLDIGRAVDHSALVVLARRWERLNMNNIEGATITYKYYITYMRRFTLGTEYNIVESETERIWNLPALIPTRNWMLVDQTGVGAPIVESLRRKRVPVTGIVITGGESVHQPAGNEWHVPKSAIVTQLLRLVQGGKLRAVKGLEWAKELGEEFDSFGYKMNRDTGTLSYESIENKVHDDLIVALAMCAWYAEAKAPPAIFGKVHSELAKDYNPLTGKVYGEK